MRNNRALLIACAILTLFTTSGARNCVAQETSTPEERAKWVAITRRLESAPLDKDNVKDGEWALRRVIEVKDVHVLACSGIMVDASNKKYKHSGELLRQYLLASASFVVENPDRATDSTATNVSAMQSVLKVYAALTQLDPKQKNSIMDDLAKNPTPENLVEYVKKQCS